MGARPFRPGPGGAGPGLLLRCPGGAGGKSPEGALAAGRPLMGRGIPLERALFHYTQPEASALPPAGLWSGERADLVVFDQDPLAHPEEAWVVRVEVDGVAVFTA